MGLLVFMLTLMFGVAFHSPVNSLGEFTTYTQSGGTLTIEDVVQVSRIDPAVLPNEEKPGALVYRLYPAFYFDDVCFPPLVFSVDVKVNAALLSSLTDPYSWNNGIVGPDLFDDYSHSAVQVALNDQSIVGGKPYLMLYHAGTPEANNFGTLAPNAPEFTADEWHRITVMVSEAGEVKLYQDGRLVSTGQYPSDSLLELRGGHAGLYVWHWYGNSVPVEGTYYADNYNVRCRR